MKVNPKTGEDCVTCSERQKAALATAQAQVAVMAKAIQAVQNLPLGTYGDVWELKAKAIVADALSPAPKVRWSGEAVLLKFDDGSQHLLFPYDKMFGAVSAADDEEYQNPDAEGIADAQVGKVIVLDKQGEGE